MQKPPALIPQKDDPFATARQKMIQDQLLPRNISDPAVLSALSQIPRHLFVPPPLLLRAYEDSALPTEDGQTISQPFMVASMTQELSLQPAHTVLEIGTGSGYQTAILSHIVGHTGQIYTIERSPTLAHSAKKLLEQLHFTNIHFHTGDGSNGWPDPYPQSKIENQKSKISFDRILVTAAAPNPPQPLLNQLNNNGILIIPLGNQDSQTLHRITRLQNKFQLTPLFDCRFVPLIGQHAF